MNFRLLLAALAVFFFCAITAHGVLSNQDINLIKIAFQNGYVTALRLNIEEIKKLKDDNTTMQKKVEDASESYLKQVQGMNK
jgi:hypothetical protein